MQKYEKLLKKHRLIMNNLWKLEIILRKKKICDFKRAKTISSCDYPVGCLGESTLPSQNANVVIRC